MDQDLEYRTHQIVMQAQEKSSADLRNFLDRACCGNDRLRREVEKRLEDIQVVLENVKRLHMWDEQNN